MFGDAQVCFEQFDISNGDKARPALTFTSLLMERLHIYLIKYVSMPRSAFLLTACL
jgi:hypothetical protein